MTLKRIEEWIEILCCPEDQANLSIKPDFLICTKCARKFPIRESILCMIDSGGKPLNDVEKETEMKARDEYAAEYHRHFPPWLNRIELPPYLKAMDLKKPDRVIELGCGTGRVTREYVAEVERVAALDFSFESLKILQTQLAPEALTKCLLIQADITQLPFKDQSFNVAASFQVLEHLPSAEYRTTSVKEARRVLHENGIFVCSVYHYSCIKQKKGIPKEGNHLQRGKPIYFFQFEKSDLQKLFLRAEFRLISLKGHVMHLLGMRWLERVGIPINRILSSTKLGLRYAHLLLIVAKR